MSGRYASVHMSSYGAILPRAAALARLPAEPSAEARRREKAVLWCVDNGRRVRLTARRFGFSPDSISRWARAYDAFGLAGLEPGSRRPKRMRQPQIRLYVVQRIQAVREEYPRLGRKKLRALLAQEGVFLSAKSIDRGSAASRPGVCGTLAHRSKLMERVGPPMIIQPPYSPELLLSMCSRKARRWVEGRLYR